MLFTGSRHANTTFADLIVCMLSACALAGLGTLLHTVAEINASLQNKAIMCRSSHAIKGMSHPRVLLLISQTLGSRFKKCSRCEDEFYPSRSMITCDKYLDGIRALIQKNKGRMQNQQGMSSKVDSKVEKVASVGEDKKKRHCCFRMAERRLSCFLTDRMS